MVADRLTRRNLANPFDKQIERPTRLGRVRGAMRRSLRTGFRACLSLVLVGAALLPYVARAQSEQLPGADRPDLPPFTEDESPRQRLELPPVPAPRRGEPGGLAAGLRQFVRGFRVEGSSVFSADELARATAPWSGREIDSAELIQARDAVTQLYLDAGFLTSGATIPDQSVDGGVVVFHVVEGAIESIEVEGTKHFEPGFFRTRLQGEGQAPVNVFELERQLQLFQRDPLVERVVARLEPGSRRGQSRLHLQVEEAHPLGLTLRASNENSPSIGSHTGGARAQVANLFRYGDVWAGEFEISEGLRSVDASASVPLPPFDTVLSIHYQRAESEVAEEPFDVLEIESRSTTYGLTVRQPLLRSRWQELAAGVTGEHRRSRTELLGECFAFVEGTTGCTSRVSVVRVFADWIRATQSHAVAARSTLSIGIHALGSTNRGGSLPDSEYLAWLGQFQWAWRLPDALLDSELLTRLDLQITGDRLLGIEKFSVGGGRTVRGYRENQFVRDNGVVASAELRVPVWRDESRRPVVQIAPFGDVGHSWDVRNTGDAETIGSIGLGLIVSPFPWLRGELYWGHALEDVDEVGADIQNDGLHFTVKVFAF